MHNTFDWAVIGAGPAGIAAIGKLLDFGISPQNIVWIDPEFKVGDFGTKWRKVSSNTKVELFLKFFRECQAFEYASLSTGFTIEQLDPKDTCLLALAAEPLQLITECLKNKVHVTYGKAQQLKLYNGVWEISLKDSTLHTKNIILATGAEPKSLSFAGVEEIPLSIALDPDKLAAVCNEEDSIAVFGSSHSAIILLKTLLENCHVKKVINFYQSPLRYAIYFDDWILFDNTGLKGIAADWARKYIDGKLPDKLERVISNQANILETLPLCHKVIYATGFEKRSITVAGMETLDYDNKSGIIAPGLFGLGIGFPEATVDRFGTLEYSVGLWKFMNYINRVMPVWLHYGVEHLSS